MAAVTLASADPNALATATANCGCARSRDAEASRTPESKGGARVLGFARARDIRAISVEKLQRSLLCMMSVQSFSLGMISSSGAFPRGLSSPFARAAQLMFVFDSLPVWTLMLKDWTGPRHHARRRLLSATSALTKTAGQTPETQEIDAGIPTPFESTRTPRHGLRLS